MDQARRDRYLAALGIVRYRSRPAAHGASASVGELAGATVDAPAVPEGPGVLLAQVQLREPRRPAAAAVESESPGAPEPLAPGSAGSEAEELLAPLRLACWRPAEDLLVLDALLPGSRPSRDQLALLGNILAAIGRRPDSLAAAEFIDWPLLPGGDPSLAGAREALGLFLAGRLAQSRFDWLLAMGKPAWRLLAGDAQAGQVLAVAGGAVRAILVPGLVEMLAEPQCKAVTWQAIRFLAPERG